MLEYFTYKKYKKRKAEKEKQDAKSEGAPAGAGEPASQSPPEARVLNEDDEAFLQHITSPTNGDGDGDDDGYRPPLPPRVKTPDISWDSDDASLRNIRDKEKDKGINKPGGKKTNRLSLFRRKSKTPGPKDGLDPARLTVPEPETDREKDDLTRVLDDLNMSARNNKAISLSADSTELVRKFTVVLKDLVNGVPTAINDLTSLLDDRDGTLAKNFEKLPKSMKKLVTQLPNKLSTTLAPELLAVAAEAQGLSKDDAAKGGLKGAAKKFLTPKSLQDLITKPGAVIGMLKAIMNALKLRWPAFIGTNVIWSVALFLLLFVLWYCHKRGREVRLEKEGQVDGSGRIEELPDDPALPAPSTSSAGRRTPIKMESRSGTTSPGLNPPVPANTSSVSSRQGPVSDASRTRK